MIHDRREIREEEKISAFSATVNIFKGSIGTGILGLPYSVKNCGILLGTIALALLGIVTVYCMHLLIISSRYLSRKYELDYCDYGDVAELSMGQFGPKLSFISRLITNIFIIFTQTGFLCVYIVFIWATIDHYIPEKNHILVFILIFGLVLSLCITTNLVVIGYFSTIASVIQCSCLTLLFIYLIIHFNGAENLKLIGDYTTLPLFFGTAMFAFEGIAVILPIENAMKKPQSFLMVVDISMGLVSVLYITSGFLGYAAFGEKVRGSVTLNLPRNLLSTIIEWGYVVAIILSYPIQFYVPIKIFESYIIIDQETWKGLAIRNTIKLLLVLFTCVAAVVIPRLETVLSLSGAFAAASISLLFPSFFHFVCFMPIKNFSKSLLLLDLFIMIVGLAGSVLGTYAAVVELIS